MKLTFPLLNTTITVPVDDTVTSGKISRRSLRKKAENKAVEQTTKTEKVSETSSTEVKPPADSTTQSTTQSNGQPILMVEVVNVTHEKFKQTEEIKVIYNVIGYYYLQY